MSNYLEALRNRNGTDQVWNKVTQTWNTIFLSPSNSGYGRQYREMKAELRRIKADARLKADPRKQAVINNGTVKLVGFALSHIYADKPN